VPYDRRKVQSRLDKGIIPQKKLQSPVRAIKTPKQSHEFHQILKYSEQLVLQDGPKELLLSALEKLSKSEIQAQVQEAVAKHETAFLKKRLNMKANHQKSRVRINKKQQGYAKLMTQDDVNEALEEYDARQRELAKIVARKSQKGEGGGVGKRKGKRATRKVTALSKDPMASGGGSGALVSDSEG
jgi:phage baseplate assembly protein W